MQSMIFRRFVGTVRVGLIVTFLALAVGTLIAFGQPPKAGPTAPPVTATTKPQLLVWDALEKEITPKPASPGELMGGTVQFFFNVTNISDEEVVIERMAASCGCTTVKMPAEPWHIAPHEHGQVDVRLTYAGKSGIFYKTIDVISPTAPAKLGVKVNLPATPMMARQANQGLAARDRQAVFKGDCASCHADKAKGKMGKELYVAACGICHEAVPRTTMVPNLHALRKVTDYDYWKTWISDGKTNSLMPAFAASAGGPLTDEQIDSLAKTLTLALPGGSSGPRAGHPNISVPRPIPTGRN